MAIIYSDGIQAFGTNNDDLIIGKSAVKELLIGRNGDDTIRTGGTREFGQDKMYGGAFGIEYFSVVSSNGSDTFYVERSSEDSVLQDSYLAGRVMVFDASTSTSEVDVLDITDVTDDPKELAFSAPLDYSTGRAFGSLKIYRSGDIKVEVNAQFDGSQGIEVLRYGNTELNIANLYTAGSIASEFFAILNRTYVGQRVQGSGASDSIKGTFENDTLLGNSGDDVLRGGSGSDLLDGGKGKDILFGGKGNDRYVVDSASDRVVERRKSSINGVDSVSATVSFALPDNVENLKLLGSEKIDGIGNSLWNKMIGNKSNNTLKGLGGRDVLRGNKGADFLEGGEGNDNLEGGAGVDVLWGGNGKDALKGGKGSDLFAYADARNGRDTILDFKRSQGDKVAVSASGFGGISKGKLKKYNFISNGEGMARDKKDYFVFSTRKNKLYFDANGSSKGGRTLLASFSKGKKLKHSDILVIA